MMREFANYAFASGTQGRTQSLTLTAAALER